MAHTNPLCALRDFGQSIWYDYIRKDFVESGALQALIAEDRLGGLTSNPSIFDKAITGSDLYDAAIAQAVRAHPAITPTALFYELAVADVQGAAEAFLPVYQATDGADGYVSLEVSPTLAHDTQGTIDEAVALWQRVDRPNLMIKVPATVAGIPAIEQLIAQGINVNVTLLFSVARYQAVLEAYLRGLESRCSQGLPIARIASVASFFVSRVDTAVDEALAVCTDSAAAQVLRGKIAIANAKCAYAHFLATYQGSRHAALNQAGARPQRLLWASTGTKNPAYSDVLYVETLIGEHTVNTVPPATYAAFKDHGQPAATLGEGLDAAAQALAQLAAVGIALEPITTRLEEEGVQAFADAFAHLLAGLQAKRERLAA